MLFLSLSFRFFLHLLLSAYKSFVPMLCYFPVSVKPYNHLFKSCEYLKNILISPMLKSGIQIIFNTHKNFVPTSHFEEKEERKVWKVWKVFIFVLTSTLQVLHRLFARKWIRNHNFSLLFFSPLSLLSYLSFLISNNYSLAIFALFCKAR